MATATQTVAASVKIQRAKNPDGSALYPDYLPFYDPLEKVEDIGEFEHSDPGEQDALNQQETRILIPTRPSS